MQLSKKFFVTVGLLSSVVFITTTAMKQGADDAKKFKNLKVLPKDISEKQLEAVMGNWSQSLGVRCNFCHARNEETKKMDWALDTKPEKNMARQMFRMTANINKKYFKAGKDSLGMVMELGVNCNTCHKGNAHPEAKAPESPRRAPRPQGPPPTEQPVTPPVQ
jgi:nitrate/TMAO reductase-like tetraheme cytochrome c subunit